MELSNEQKEALEQFRENVADILEPSHDDYYLLRWLIARKFDLNRAESMLRDHMKTRRKFGLATILKDFQIPEVIVKSFPYGTTGFDKDGNIVAIGLWGISDFRGISYSLTPTQLVKALFAITEGFLIKMDEHNKKSGKQGKKAIVIFDLKEQKMHHFLDAKVVRRMLLLLNAFQANYPEILKVSYVVNVPSFFVFWFNVVKNQFDKEFIQKFKIYDTNGWKEDILKYVEAEAIPAFMGGKLTDPDGNPQCRTVFVSPEKVPLNLYLGNRKYLFTKDPDMTRVVIRERSHFDVPISIKSPNLVIRWRFCVLQHDIQYALYYSATGVKPKSEDSIIESRQSIKSKVRSSSKDGLELMMPLERVESLDSPIEGEFYCERAGIYLLHFDNTFSWMTSKEVCYKTEVLTESEVLESP